MPTNNSWNSPIPVPISLGGTDATSFTQSNGIVTYNGTSLVNYAGPQISSGGVQNNSSQPAFFASKTSNTTNATGDGTIYTVIFDTIVKNQGSGYNNSTGIFTAPVTGIYVFTTSLLLENIAVASNIAVLAFAGSVYNSRFLTLGISPAIYNSFGGSGSFIVPMTSGDTMSVTAALFGGTKTTTVFGDAAGDTLTNFGGFLLC